MPADLVVRPSISFVRAQHVDLDSNMVLDIGTATPLSKGTLKGLLLQATTTPSNTHRIPATKETRRCVLVVLEARLSTLTAVIDVPERATPPAAAR